MRTLQAYTQLCPPLDSMIYWYRIASEISSTQWRAILSSLCWLKLQEPPQPPTALFPAAIFVEGTWASSEQPF